MPFLHLVILALIQGVTEFLPISSSGHLALYPLLTGAEDQGLKLDVATHIGSLAAVMLYFRADVAMAARGALRVLRWDLMNREAHLALLLLVATVPAVLAGGVLAALGWAEALRSLAVIGWATLIGGLLLYLADRYGRMEKAEAGWTLKDAALIGLAQAAALVPGVSRSGITITAARALGYGRVDAARVSFLMSIPVTMAAALLVLVEVAESGDAALQADVAIAAVLSFLAAYAAIALFLRMLRTWSMNVFVVYRLFLGAGLLYLAYA